MQTDASPGVALRLTALAAAAAMLLTVVSGILDAGVAHRVLAALALPTLIGLALVATFVHRRLATPAWTTLVLFVGAALVPGRPFHIALAALALASAAWLTVCSWRGQAVARGSARDYLTLTKPRIMTLLLLTGACGMFVGDKGVPPAGSLLVMLVGLALACGGASALNHVLDRDIDRLMGARTANRPVASGRMTAPRAFEFGVALSAASFVILASTINLLTAVLALVGNLFYVVVYTGYLKRRGPGNIVLGGAAGAVPPLVGYAAATGNLALPALWLFLIVFFWTPPHFWALALLLRKHYAAADIPMLPVVLGDRVTARRILGYTLALVALTALPVVTGTFGAVYLVAAIGLGVVFIVLAAGLLRSIEGKRAALVFHYSLLYLALLFVFAAVDSAL
jgi:protoheme IX farnesyltransferase